MAARITPAYAGKSFRLWESGKKSLDHPRLCGEKGKNTNRTKINSGSPPPMRGKAKAGTSDTVKSRITPAYAGKRWKEKVREKVTQDHPRLCGEKFTIIFLLIGLPGSPPPMRGKVPQFSQIQICDGITPAYAGKSGLRSKVERNHRDHPRLCGEKMRTAAGMHGDLGSPPPMRGKGRMRNGY